MGELLTSVSSSVKVGRSYRVVERMVEILSELIHVKYLAHFLAHIKNQYGLFLLSLTFFFFFCPHLSGLLAKSYTKINSTIIGEDCLKYIYIYFFFSYCMVLLLRFPEWLCILVLILNSAGDLLLLFSAGTPCPSCVL